MNPEVNSQQSPEEKRLNLTKQEESKQDEVKENNVIKDESSTNAPVNEKLGSSGSKHVGVDDHARPVPPRK